MSVIRGQLNIKNAFPGVADAKFKFVIINDEKDFSCDELFFSDIPPSIEANFPFSAIVPSIARKRLSNANVAKVTVELETCVRPILSNNLTGPLEYHIYRAKFNEPINLPFEGNSLNIEIGREKFSLNDPKIGNFNVNPILAYTHHSTFNEKRVAAHSGCPVSRHSSTITYKERDEWFFRFVEGLDNNETPVNEKDLKEFKFDDNFGSKLVKLWKDQNFIEVYRYETIPFTLRSLLIFLRYTERDNPDIIQNSFVVSDGANIPWSEETKNINRQVRFVVTCQSDKEKEQPIDLIFIVSSPSLDSDDRFLQVAAWSRELKAFNFYQRNNKKEWWWLGNSWHALEIPTRGKGPFDGHVNGSLVMKELNRPWLHWNSQFFTISDCLDPEDPLRNEHLFKNRSDATDLEHIVKDAISAWNTARLGKHTNLNSFEVTHVKEFMRQIIDNTTYNIIASEKEFLSITPQDDLFLPASFFINLDVLNQLTGFIDPDLSPIKVRADMYLKSIKKYGVCLKAKLEDGEDKGKTVIVQQGDGMFVFPVPEPAYEDTSLLQILLNKRKLWNIPKNIDEENYLLPLPFVEVSPLLSYKFTLCLFMIDFCNPLDSRHRSRLLEYIPETTIYNKSTNKYDLVDKFVEKITEAVKFLPKHSPEAVFLQYWQLSDEVLRSNCKRMIEQYFTNLQINLQKQDGVDDLVRLADSRRRMFRRKPLSEFDLTFPMCNNIQSDALMLEMTPLGTVQPFLKYTLPKFPLVLTLSNNAYILEKFDPPAYLEDMNDNLKNEWNEIVQKWTRNTSEGYPDDYTSDGPRLQYYDPTSTYTSADYSNADIVWTAFPNKIRKISVTDKQRWEAADSTRDVQDEYCEWSVLRDPETGKITKVTFTCEGPEYWSLIAEKDPDKLVQLYKDIISQDVKKQDLFDSDNNYILDNKWNGKTNTGNIMHLIQKNNTLEAEIELAGGSSVVRVIDGHVLTSEQELIKCGTYGNPDRFSDPHIGAIVNSFTRQSADVTICNPVAIYLDKLDTSSFDTPDGSEADSYWKFTRGNEEAALYVRGVFEVPSDKDFCVGDIKINGMNIKYGAQIADYLTIRIRAVACRFGKSTIPVLTSCRKEKSKNPSIVFEGLPMPAGPKLRI